jgi:hypothetical protein
MRPFYDTRVRDPAPGDFVQVERVCGHTTIDTGDVDDGRFGAV